METLKDKKYLFEDCGGYGCSVHRDGYYIAYKDVKEAVLEDFQDLDNLIKSIDENTDIYEVIEKLKIHRKLKLWRFGDFEK